MAATNVEKYYSIRDQINTTIELEQRIEGDICAAVFCKTKEQREQTLQYHVGHYCGNIPRLFHLDFFHTTLVCTVSKSFIKKKVHL